MLDRTEFIKFLISQHALKFGDFTTKSGRKSPYFINMGEFGTGEAINQLGEFYAAKIIDLMEAGDITHDIDNIFGPAYKGIPLCITAAASLARNHGADISWSFNRKEVKDHGEGGSFIGEKLNDGDKVLILDDVITAGTAVREVLPLLTGAADIDIRGMVIAVDRMERGQSGISAVAEVLKDFGIRVFSIITVRDIIDYLRVLGESDELITRMEAYMADYGA